MSCKDCDDNCRQGRLCPHRKEIDLFKAIRSYFTLRKIADGWTDAVSGKAVSYYEDCFGDVYMKDSRWSLFKVKVDGGV